MKTDIAKEYRIKFGMKKPTLALARIMYAENNLMFKDVEDARGVLRYIEGKQSTGKSNTKDQTFFIENRPLNPYSLPQSEETKFEPFVFSGHKRIGILSDIHLPYHSMEALTIALKWLKELKIDGLLLNGDTIDAHMLSRYEKDPRKRNFALELDTFRALFNVLQKEFNCKIYFKLGNHEIRYQKFLQQKAGELVGVEEFEFENIIKARAEGIQMIGDKTVMKLNGLNGIHGHEYLGSSPANIARGLFVKGKVNAFQGHNHHSSEHIEIDMDGKATTTYSIGTLGELHPAYLPLNNWNWGMAMVELDDNKVDFEFHNKKIIKGKIY
jgi:predicted phosphodiesterase